MMERVAESSRDGTYGPSWRKQKIDGSKPWRITHELQGHTSDVRALTLVTPSNSSYEVFQSVSRDETARTWIRSWNEHDNVPSSYWTAGPTHKGQRYQNAVAYVETDAANGTGLSMMGGLDARILVYRTVLRKGKEEGGEEPIQVIQEHHDNVCHLAVSSEDRTPAGSPPLLISASWDATSRVWTLQPDAKVEYRWKSLFLLKGHQRSVLDAQVLSAESGQERFLTASADLTIRYWQGDTAIRILRGHEDVVRGIALLPTASDDKGNDGTGDSRLTNEQFATCSNDGTVKLWPLLVEDTTDDADPATQEATDDSLTTLIPREADGTPVLDLLFAVHYAGCDGVTGHHLLLTGGEGGRIELWDVDQRIQVGRIQQPVTTCWDLLLLPRSGDLATADSDGKIRIYTQRPSSSASVEDPTISSDAGHQGALSAAQLKWHDERCSEVARARVRATIVAREATDRGSDEDDDEEEGEEDNMFDGQRYDAILKIDVSDDAEPLSLPINRGDDAGEKARQFIAQHGLSQNYEQDIIAFINQVGPGAHNRA